MFRKFSRCVRHSETLVLKNSDFCLHTKPNFTKNNFNIARGAFNYLRDHHVTFFKDLLGENRVIMDLSDLEKYNVDWFKQVRGCSAIVLKPQKTEEVSQILKFCNDNLLAVCPQGGNTGVVGGAIPVFDEVVISTELMNDILSLDETSGILTCQAGCILEKLDDYLAEKGLMTPLDLGAKGSCQIGGNLSTNAGGLRLLRYGNLHGNVLGLEAVKANGDIIDCLSSLKKDNTGYHLKHLFIGSEGTLGIITKVAIQCPTRPKFKNVAFLGCQKYEKILKTFRKAKQDLGEILSATEVMDAATMKFINERLETPSPIGDYPFYLLIETSGSNEDHDTEKLNNFFEDSLNKGLILNGTVASEPSKINEIWSLRERIPEGFARDGFVYCYDISLPLGNYYTLVDDMRTHLGNVPQRVFGFGHLGDGNLHLQVSVKEYSSEVKNKIEPHIFKRTTELKGSISAEHGMGFLKGKYLPMARPNSIINLMRDLKSMMDPNGILNPYKVFPN